MKAVLAEYIKSIDEHKSKLYEMRLHEIFGIEEALITDEFAAKLTMNEFSFLYMQFCERLRLCHQEYEKCKDQSNLSKI